MTAIVGNLTETVNGDITDLVRRVGRSFYRTMLKDVVERVEKRLEALGMSASAASRAAGLSIDAIRNMKRAVDAGKDRQGVSTATIMALAPVLGTTAGWLLEGEGEEAPPNLQPPTPARHPRGEVAGTRVGIPDLHVMPRDLPVFGSAAAAIVTLPARGGARFEGFALDRARPVEHVGRPPALAGSPDAYAVRVIGESMSPRYEPGELIVVHPHRPVRPGDTALIVVRPGEDLPEQAFVKRFIGRTPESVIAEQLNPRARMMFKGDTVIAVHRVLTMAEVLAG